MAVIMNPPQPNELLKILNTWLDAQSQSQGDCDLDHILHRDSNTVTIRVLVSAGPNFRTSCDLPAKQCDNVNKLLKTTWEAVQEKVTSSVVCEPYKWWEGVLLIGHSSLETNKGRRVKLLGMNIEHQKRWVEWGVRNIEGGYQQVYTVGVAFGVPCGKRMPH